MTVFRGDSGNWVIPALTLPIPLYLFLYTSLLRDQVTSLRAPWVLRCDWTVLRSNVDFIKCVNHSFCFRKSRYNSSSLWWVLYLSTFLALLQLTVCVLNSFSERKSLCDLMNDIFIELILGKYFFQALPCFDCLITRMGEGVWPNADILDGRPRLAVHWTVSAHRFRRLSLQVLERLAKLVARLLAAGDGMRSARDCRWHLRWLETFRVRQSPLFVLALVSQLQTTSNGNKYLWNWWPERLLRSTYYFG